MKLCDFGISGRLVDSQAFTRGAGCAAFMAVGASGRGFGQGFLVDVLGFEDGGFVCQWVRKEDAMESRKGS